MNEEIEYAEMLEIPVSTVNLVKKKRRRKKTEPTEKTQSLSVEEPLKDKLLAHVNGKLQEDSVEEAPTNPQPIRNVDEIRDFDPLPERVETVRLYPPMEISKTEEIREDSFEIPLENQEKGGDRVGLNKQPSKIFRVLFGTEFALACALCGGIFVTNALLPNSGLNTFFRAVAGITAQTDTVDNRVYSDFALSRVVSDFSDAELSISSSGVLTFQDACCVYPVADGKVSEIIQENGVYTLKINYSDSFSGVFQGLDQAYYQVGQEVKANLPLGYTNGNKQVQVTMYDNGSLLNCFQVTEENCLAWLNAD